LIGTQLAHFRITAKLGEGGMGAVYRAEDTRLGREVAIKVLPEALVDDPDRLARFEREARVLASLDHPAIAGVHEVGHAVPQAPSPTTQAREGGGQAPIHFLVLQLAPGETLEERIARGPVPVDESIPIALQIAEALEAAHEKGIVHRDLKPANVKVDAEGRVKVLDFGLAKALEGGTESETARSLSMSPTLTGRATMGGVLLGTAAYMSPEQAKGVPADKRADIWAFGVVLWEMLTGRGLFAGDTVSETLAAVLRDAVDPDELPSGVPARLHRLVARCLERDPKLRLRDIGEARIALTRPEEEQAPEQPLARPASHSRWREGLAWGVAAIAVTALIVVGARRTPREPPAPLHFSVALSPDQRLAFVDQPILAISPDGRRLAFSAADRTTGHDMIHVRDLDRLDVWAVPGTEGATDPFFSPDGRSVAFFADQELKRVAIGGGTPTSLAAAPNPRGGVWGDDDTILFSPDYSAPLTRISAGGGTPEALIGPDEERGERTYRWPDLLPGGRSALFTIGTLDSPNDYDDALLVAHSFETGERRVLVEGANMGRFLPPDTLLFSRGGILYATPFDLDALELTGQVRPVRDDVAGDPSSGAGYWAVSDTGTLAFVPGAAASESHLALVGRDGETSRLPLAPRGFHQPRFSPDGTRIAFAVGKGLVGAGGDIWVYALDSQALSRVTFSGGIYPAWTPDGSRIAFTRSEKPDGVFLASADGLGAEEHLLDFDSAGTPMLAGAWSPDGRTLAYTSVGTSNIYLVTDGSEPRLFEEDAAMPAFSPDGRWLVYSAPASGNTSVYVRPVDGPGKWQVSPGLGGYPRWSGDGSELFYIDISSPARSLMAAPVLPGPTFRAGPPTVIVPDLGFRYTTSTAPQLNWDATPDGRSFVFVEVDRDDAERSRIEVVLDWASTLGLAER